MVESLNVMLQKFLSGNAGLIGDYYFQKPAIYHPQGVKRFRTEFHRPNIDLKILFHYNHTIPVQK
jgi:hypothetical protein